MGKQIEWFEGFSSISEKKEKPFLSVLPQIRPYCTDY